MQASIDLLRELDCCCGKYLQASAIEGFGMRQALERQNKTPETRSAALSIS